MTHSAGDQLRIGLIGLGMMGHGIGRNLLAKGFALNVLGHVNRTPVESLKGLGARDAGDIATLVTNSDIIIFCVTGSPQIEDAIYRPDGVLAHLREGQIVIDCSTSDPSSSERICQDLVAKGGLFVDAPLGRTPVEAEQGRLNVMVGASPEMLERVRPVLAAFAENIIHVGDTLSAQRLKLINNFAIVSTACILSEALEACRLSGVEPDAMYQLMSKGPLGGGLLDMLIGQVNAGHYDAMKFSIGNADKDIGYFNAMTAGQSRRTELSKNVAEILSGAVARGQDKDFLPELSRPS